MIIFDKLWDVMKEKGVSTYQLREKCGIDSKTVRRLQANVQALQLGYTRSNDLCSLIFLSTVNRKGVVGNGKTNSDPHRISRI